MASRRRRTLAAPHTSDRLVRTTSFLDGEQTLAVQLQRPCLSSERVEDASRAAQRCAHQPSRRVNDIISPSSVTNTHFASPVSSIASARAVIRKSRHIVQLNRPQPTMEQTILSALLAPQDPLLLAGDSAHSVDISPPTSQSTAVVPWWLKKDRRNINIVPEKILDAPGIADDFYMSIMDWSANDQLAVALGHELYLWTGGSVISFYAHPTHEPITAVAFSPGESCQSATAYPTPSRVTRSGRSETLLSAFDDGTMMLFDVGTRRKLFSSRYHNGARVSTAAWAIDGSTVSGKNTASIFATGDSVGKIAFWDARQCGGVSDGSVTLSSSKQHSYTRSTGLVQQLPNSVHGRDIICSIKFSFDGQLFATGGNNNSFAIWDMRNIGYGPLLTKVGVEGHISAVRAIAWSPWQRNLLATAGGSNDRTLKTWDSYTGQNFTTRSTYSQVTNMYFSPHYRELITSHGFASPDIHNIMPPTRPEPQVCSHSQRHPNSSHAAMLSNRPSGNHLTVWSYPSLEPVWIMDKAHNERVLYMAMSPDGQVVATASADENLKFWRVFDGQPTVTQDKDLTPIRKPDELISRSRSHTWASSRFGSIPKLYSHSFNNGGGSSDNNDENDNIRPQMNWSSNVNPSRLCKFTKNSQIGHFERSEQSNWSIPNCMGIPSISRNRSTEYTRKRKVQNGSQQRRGNRQRSIPALLSGRLGEVIR